MNKFALLSSLPLLLGASTALAEEDPKPEYIDAADAAIEEDGSSRTDGIDWRINAGATFTMQDNRGVVGQQEGTAVGFGFKLDGGLDLHEGDHEWRNSLGVAAGATRTPAVDRFVKSQDNLDLETIYLYHITDWFGAFGRVAYNTTMFRGADVRPSPTSYEILRLDGATETPAGVTTLNLTDPFLPSRFKESLGFFAQPIRDEPVSVEVRLGGGGRQTLARGQLAIDDDGSDDIINIKELDDVVQFGAEAALEVWGSFDDKRVTYKASAEAMTPFYNNQSPPPGEASLSTFELTNIALKAGFSVKIVEWASLDYELAAIREPQLINRFQVRNNLLVTFGIAAGSESEAPAE